MCAGWEKWNPNRLVPWYLMASYLYYQKDVSIISDAIFDGMCKRLLLTRPRVTHPHKHLIDIQALKAGTGYHIKEADYPGMCKGAALRLAKEAGLVDNRSKP